MAKQLQLRRGTTSETSTFKGAEGEVVIDTTKNQLVVHDGIKIGGFPVAREVDLNNLMVQYLPMPYPKSTPPVGHLVMMGQTIDQVTYPILFSLYGGTLPDMRAYSIRGLDYGRGIDVGRTVLSQQGDAIRNITGAISTGAYNSGASGVFADQGTSATRPDGESRAAISVGFDASRVVPTASENRVKNIAFLYIVKAG